METCPLPVAFSRPAIDLYFALHTILSSHHHECARRHQHHRHYHRRHICTRLHIAPPPQPPSHQTSVHCCHLRRLTGIRLWATSHVARCGARAPTLQKPSTKSPPPPCSAHKTSDSRMARRALPTVTATRVTATVLRTPDQAKVFVLSNLSTTRWLLMTEFTTMATFVLLVA